MTCNPLIELIEHPGPVITDVTDVRTIQAACARAALTCHSPRLAREVHDGS